MSALWTIAVTDQQCRLLSDGAGYAWVEEWRAGELVAVTFAEDLHPDRYAREVGMDGAADGNLPWASFFE